MLKHLTISFFPQVVGSCARRQQCRTAGSPFEQVLSSDAAACLVVAADIGHGGGEVTVDTDYRQMNRPVVGQTVVVGAGDDAVHPMGEEKVEIFLLSIRLTHGIADECPVAAVGQKVFDMLGEFTEEGQSDGGDDQPD